MKVQYFENNKNIKRMQYFIREWLGTPYRHMCKVKSRGVDCATFIIGLLEDMEIVNSFSLGFYPRDWHINGKTDLFLENIENFRDKIATVACGITLDRIDGPYYKFGDWLVFCLSPKGYANHSAIYLGDNKVVHCINGRGVVIDPVSKLGNKIKVAYRLHMEKNK
jgi:cell wall-associated NlpC family hydrolase